jgi:hypothetical protein
MKLTQMVESGSESDPGYAERTLEQTPGPGTIFSAGRVVPTELTILNNDNITDQKR